MRSPKDIAKANSLLVSLVSPQKAAQIERAYRQRRDRYFERARILGLTGTESEALQRLQVRFEDRGYSTTPRKRGGVHTFAFVNSHGWHDSLIREMRELGPVTRYDYIEDGFAHGDFRGGRSWSRRNQRLRTEMNERFLNALRKAHEERPVDWVFTYGIGRELLAQTFRVIREELGVPTVDISFDDKQSWVGIDVGGQCAGVRDLTSEVDLFVTSSSATTLWHHVEGGRAIYLPEGFDAELYFPMEVERDIPVSFVGARYGFRERRIHELRKRSLDIRAFGNGWPGGWVEDMAEVYNRSRINLGMGGILYSETLTNVKGRDFEVTGTGGGAYLTRFNADLACHFVIGEEILCYQSVDELVELLNHYLARPDETAEIGRRARERALKEHRWLHRYQHMLNLLGILG